MGTALFSVALSLVIPKKKITTITLLHHGVIIQFVFFFFFINGVMSQKVVYDGRKIYFNVLMSHFKKLCMFVLIRALIHSERFHFS